MRATGDVEAKVEVAVNELLEAYFRRAYPAASVVATKAYQTDGLITVTSPSESFSVLVEAKRSYELGSSARDRAKIIAQAIGYLKRFELKGEALPSAVVFADEDEIFTLPLRLLSSYLRGAYDWSLAPSSQWEDHKLFLALSADPNFNSIYVEATDREFFDPEHFCGRVESYATDRTELEKLRVDKHSLEKAFAEFQRVVFGGVTASEKTNKVELFGSKKSVTYAQVQIFIKALLGDKNIYLDPVDRKTVIILYKDHKGRECIFRYPPETGFTFNGEAYEQFFTKYDRGLAVYDRAARQEITEIADTLFDEFDRRFTGDYWTPQIWVDEAHRMIEDQLGLDWKDNFVVWDPACGSKNLTRGYKFKELYCSTLHQEELNIAEDYNPEATTFQYDFLNDDMAIHKFQDGLNFGEEDEFGVTRFKLPDSLIEALKANKPIVFFGNPPYGQSGKPKDGTSKSGISSTAVSSLMGRYSKAKTELYTQFIYRVQLLAKAFNYKSDLHFFFFKKAFMPSPNFKTFTDQLTEQFSFQRGFMLNAGEFKGTSSAWGIIFTHWKLDPNSKKVSEFPLTVKATVTEAGAVKELGSWTAKSLSKDETIAPLCVNPKFPKAEAYPATSNGFDSSNAQNRSIWSLEALGAYTNAGQDVQHSDAYINLLSLPFNNGGTVLLPSNFTTVTSVFSIRKSCLELIRASNLLWVRDKDVFPAPSKALQADLNFATDCVAYSLFASGSNQTSLRGYEYGGKKWDVKNEFFWIPNSWVREWAVDTKVWNVREDADLFTGERHVSTWLASHYEDLSPAAKALLKTARSIVKASMKYRPAYDLLHPKYNLLTWDAGWLQIYKMCYSRDALPAAKNDVYLQRLYGEFKAHLRALGDSIAQRYSDDTGF